MARFDKGLMEVQVFVMSAGLGLPLMGCLVLPWALRSEKGIVLVLWPGLLLLLLMLLG